MLYLLLILLIIVALLIHVRSDKTFEELVPLYADCHSRFFKWRGIDVHFKDEGQGIPIVFLHGSSSSLHTWDKLTSCLKDHYRIVRMDLPGFGLTGPHPERDYSLKAYVKFLDDFMKHVNVSHFIVAGNSWGGQLAWYYAALNQRKVTGLILIDAAGYRMSRIPKRFQAYHHFAGRWVLRYTMAAWLVKMGLKEAYSSTDLIDNVMVTRYLNLTLREGNRQAFLDFIHDREWPDLKLLSLIQSPTLILWGRLDRMYNVEQAFAFQENLSNAAVAIVEDTGHMPMEEAPDVCAEHIHEFVST